MDASRESAACLACVYLNEYRTAVAAFTLHAAELKIVRVSRLFSSTRFKGIVSRDFISINVYVWVGFAVDISRWIFKNN